MRAITDNVLVAVLTAIVLGALTLFWNWASGGGVVRALGGVTLRDIEVKLNGNFIAPSNLWDGVAAEKKTTNKVVLCDDGSFVVGARLEIHEGGALPFLVFTCRQL